MGNTNPRDSAGRFTKNPPVTKGGWSMDIPIEPLITYMQTTDEKIAESEKRLKEHRREVKSFTNSTIGVIRAGWGMLQGLIRATGGSISITQRLMVSAVLGGVQAIVPLLTAAEGLGVALKDPTIMIPVAMGLLEVGTATAALIAYQNEAREASKALRGLNFMTQNMSNLLSMWG